MIRIDNIESIVKNFSTLCGDDRDAVVVGNYETIVEALNYLVKNTNSYFVCGELSFPEVDGYDGGYYIIFDNKEIWTGKIKTSDACDCVMFECDYAYVEDCYQKDYLSNNTKHGMVVFTYDDIEEDDHEDDDNHCVCMDDDRMGFCLCINENDFHHKFKYRGNKKLTDDDVINICNEYL